MKLEVQMPRGIKRGNQYLPTGFEGNLLLSVLGFLCGRTALAVILVSFLVGHWPFWVPALRAVCGFFGCSKLLWSHPSHKNSGGVCCWSQKGKPDLEGSRGFF